MHILCSLQEQRAPSLPSSVSFEGVQHLQILAAQQGTQLQAMQKRQQSAAQQLLMADADLGLLPTNLPPALARDTPLVHQCFRLKNLQSQKNTPVMLALNILAGELLKKQSLQLSSLHLPHVLLGHALLNENILCCGRFHAAHCGCPHNHCRCAAVGLACCTTSCLLGGKTAHLGPGQAAGA